MLRFAAIALVIAVALGLLTFALPVPAWRTGELPAGPLDFLPTDSIPAAPARIWIDTDAACGTGRRTDPDDCLALLLLARDPGLDIAGISTVFGNAPLSTTDSVTRALVAKLAAARTSRPIRVFRGAAGAGDRSATPARVALRSALEAGPLTVVALGPLTNVASALAGRPDLRARVGRVVAVMGRHPGHLFHPAEGAGGGILFGHGPVFRDFNVALDRTAAAEVLRAQLPLLLVPYEAAREVELTGADLDRIAGEGDAGAWVSDRAREWLDYWRRDIGRKGFYPFDLVAALQVADPSALRCARVDAWVGRDPSMRWPFTRDRVLLIASVTVADEEAVARGGALYCPALALDGAERLRARLETAVTPTP